MADPVVDPTKPPAPAPAKTEEKTPDAINVERLKELYKATPQMFEDAGIVKKPDVKPLPQSAAPADEWQSVKLPEDAPAEWKTATERYLTHAKSVGLTAKQAQAEIDFQVQNARDAVRAQKTPEQVRAEQDAQNVTRLRAEFGDKYDQRMEAARLAAIKYGEPELLERLETSDPVLVRHFDRLARLNAEDSTPGAPNRNGHESDVKDRQKQLKDRYPNTPSMFES